METERFYLKLLGMKESRRDFRTQYVDLCSIFGMTTREIKEELGKLKDRLSVLKDGAYIHIKFE